MAPQDLSLHGEKFSDGRGCLSLCQAERGPADLSWGTQNDGRTRKVTEQPGRAVVKMCSGSRQWSVKMLRNPASPARSSFMAFAQDPFMAGDAGVGEGRACSETAGAWLT